MTTRDDLAGYTSGVLRARADYYGTTDPKEQPMKQNEKPLTVEQAEVLAEDLVAELATHPGDDAAVCAVMLRWLDVLGAGPLAQVSLAAMRTIFGRCLIPHPDSVPTDALTIDPTKAGAPA